MTCADADFLMFSDAEGGGDTGAVLFPRESPPRGPTSWYTAGRVPKKWQTCLNSRKTQINLFGQAAVLLAIGTFAPLLGTSLRRNRNVKAKHGDAVDERLRSHAQRGGLAQEPIAQAAQER